MSVHAASLRVTVDSEACRASIASLAKALELRPELADLFVDGRDGRFVLGDDLGGLFRCEPIDASAARAGELHGLRIMPDQRYIELVSAITRDGDPHVSGFVHGWPILSLGTSDLPSEAGRGGESISAPEGAS